MQIVNGNTISDRVTIGPVRVYHREEHSFASVSALSHAAERDRFRSALSIAQTQLDRLYQLALETVGDQNAAIFQIHQMMLEDDDYLDAVQAVIQEHDATAELAVAAVRTEFAATFAAIRDPYMRARAADVKDVSLRLLDILTGAPPHPILRDAPAILAADDLTPSELMELDRSRLLGFVTRDPYTDSHTAILARAMSIPALTGIKLDDGWAGRTAVLDGPGGRLCLDPTSELLAEVSARQDAALIKT